MCAIAKDATEILVAGCQESMFKIDMEKGDVLQTVNEVVLPGLTLLTKSSWSRQISIQ